MLLPWPKVKGNIPVAVRNGGLHFILPPVILFSFFVKKNESVKFMIEDFC